MGRRLQRLAAAAFVLTVALEVHPWARQPDVRWPGAPWPEVTPSSQGHSTAARGFGGQLLLIIPSRDIVAVTNAGNVFGAPARNIFGPLLDALTADGQP